VGKKQPSIYLRLIDFPVSDKPLDEQLADVKRAVDQLGRFEWLSPSSLHPAGGFVIQIRPVEPPDLPDWLVHLEQAGYRNVI